MFDECLLRTAAALGNCNVFLKIKLSVEFLKFKSFGLRTTESLTKTLLVYVVFMRFVDKKKKNLKIIISFSVKKIPAHKIVSEL